MGGEQQSKIHDGDISDMLINIGSGSTTEEKRQIGNHDKGLLDKFRGEPFTLEPRAL